MRDDLRSLGEPDHVGLAYEAWAPVGEGGKVPDGDEVGQSGAWLRTLARSVVSSDYQHAFTRWRSSFSRHDDRIVQLELASRLLIGHGNPSGTDVGITLHRAWGVPIIPGSAIKGLLAHYVDAVYGPVTSAPPWEQPEGERERARFQGVVWKERRIQYGPGEVYRALFGAPEADEDSAMRERQLPAGATSGLVQFHDALYVPGSAQKKNGDGAESGDCPFAVDVLTVHQKSYYDSGLANPAGATAMPNDYDSPVPVAFLSVKPGAQFLFALSGPPGWTELAARLLESALEDWGVGGKTSGGYGRLLAPEKVEKLQAKSPGPYQRHQPLRVTRIEGSSGKNKLKFMADDGVPGHFAGETPPPVDIGATLEAWVANVGNGTYTLTLRDPASKKGK